MKKLAQPTRSFFTLKISWKTSPGWLQLVFHFGTENWADQLKKPPCSRLLESSGKMGQVDQNWGAEYEHFYFGRLKNYKITHLPPHFTKCKSITRVQLKIYQFFNTSMFDPTTHSRRESECVTTLCDETQISTQTNMGWLRFYSKYLSNNLAGGGSAPSTESGLKYF